MNSDAPFSHARAAPAAHTGEARWQVRLLGAVEAFDGVQRIQRFPSRAVAALLARLALAPERAHAREELVELLWPGVSLAVGRNRLRQALSTLKSLLEPAGVPGAAVLEADRLSLRVVRGALGCDALDFERLLRSGRTAEAQALYGGELMPGYYDEWIDAERQRLLALFDRVQAAPPAAPPAVAQPVLQPSPAPLFTLPEAAVPPLPTYLTRLFGADLAAARLRAQVQTRRLVTLLGPGGSGKTRLGVEVAQALRQPPLWAGEGGSATPFERIAFVPLVACEDAAQMLDATARALQLAAAGGTVDALVQALAGQRALLVLDNFEQLVDRAEGAVAELLSRLPALHVLVTSRRALGLDGETVVSAEPLPLPAADAPLAAAAANPAVALFVDRARAARADFHLAERNHGAIVTLVRALQGMPLAIELAASRVRSFPPAEMVAMLGAGEAGAHLQLLSRGGPRAGHDARHASMAQVIAWSWRLLDADAQRVMAALVLFPADAGTAAVAAVLPDAVGATAARLDDLVGHSLVRSSLGDGDTPRFSLVAPVREFVAAHVAAEDLQAQRTRLRHWLIHWAAALGPAAPPAQVAPELPTVHAVLDAAAEAPADALALALALRRYWETDGLPGRVLLALETALATVAAQPGADQALLSEAHELLAYLWFGAGQRDVAQLHAQAAVAAAGNDPARRARMLVRRAWVDIAAGLGEDRRSAHHQALRADLDEALALARASGDREAQARALQQQAVLASNIHVDADGADLVRADALFAQSQALWLALGERRQAFARLRNRAQCWVSQGRRAEARATFEQCEQAARDDGDWVGMMDAHISLSAVHAELRDWDAALQASRRCIHVAWGRWHRHGLAYGLWNAPRLLARLRRPEAAMRLLAFAARFWTEGFGPLRADDEHYVRLVRALVRAQVGAARAEALWLEGAGMDTASAVQLALRD